MQNWPFVMSYNTSNFFALKCVPSTDTNLRHWLPYRTFKRFPNRISRKMKTGVFVGNKKCVFFLEFVKLFGRIM